MSDILTKIEAAKAEIATAKRAHPQADVEARAKAASRRAVCAHDPRKLARGEYALIAGIKKASPSKG
jgi:indole-3-glycerol phosphate synthase